MMADATITILDPAGKDWPLIWASELTPDPDTGQAWYCDFCDASLSAGWVHYADDEDERALVLCQACAAAQEQAVGREEERSESNEQVARRSA